MPGKSERCSQWCDSFYFRKKVYVHVIDELFVRLMYLVMFNNSLALDKVNRQKININS